MEWILLLYMEFRDFTDYCNVSQLKDRSYYDDTPTILELHFSSMMASRHAVGAPGNKKPPQAGPR